MGIFDIFSGGGGGAQFDPADVSKAIETFRNNNFFNQITPTGSFNFGSIDPKTGQFKPLGSNLATKTTGTPFQGQLQGLQERLALLLGGNAIGGATAAGIGSGRGLPGDFSNDASRVERATFDRAMGLLDPVFERDQNRLDQELANAGLPVGSEIFADRQKILGDAQNEARVRAALDSVGAGRQEQSRLAGLSLASRDQLLQEIAAAMGAGNIQSASLPNFLAPATVNTFAPEQLRFGASAANANAANQFGQAGLGGLFDLGSALILSGGFPF